MNTQVDQNREDEDGRISQDAATPTAGTNQADTLDDVEAHYKEWDYARLKHLEMQGIMAQREMREAKKLTPEAVVGFIHQLSPWNLKTTGIAILEAYADTKVSDLRLDSPETKEEL